MAKDLRYIPPNSLVEVTNRTLHARFLLRPSHQLNTIIEGAIGRAQRRYGMRIVAYVWMANHFHMLLLPKDAKQLSRFIGYLQSKVAKEAGRLHDFREKFWARRYRGIVVSDEDEVHVARLRYILENGCKEGLVDSPKQWPGASTTKALLTGKPIEGLWFDRTKEYNARRSGKTFRKLDFADQETITLTPLPQWRDLPEHKRQAEIRAMVREIEAEAEQRVKETGRPPLGVNAIYQQQPHARPANSKRSPAPRFHAKAGHVRRALERGYQRFHTAYREAAGKLREGATGVEFPWGSFPPPAGFVRLPGQAGYG